MSHEHSSSTGNGDQTEHTESPKRSIAEWTTLAISVAILVGALGLVSWLHFSGGERPAVVTVEPQMDQIRQDDGGYYLPVTVRNEGDVTVENVQIQGILDTGSGESETADFTIMYLVGDEEVHGTFVFQEDPSEGDLTTAAGSYTLP